MIRLPGIVLDLTGNDFLLPYMQQQFPVPNDQPDYKMPDPTVGVRIVSAQSPGNNDADFDLYCQEAQLPVTSLHCPYIIGTGMNGLPRRIAAGIYRGSYMQIRDNEACISLVHAVDVAAAAALAQKMSVQGSYTLTDGNETLINDLAEALAYRMGNKRLFSIKARWARWWYGSQYYTLLTSNHVFPSTFQLAFPDFKTHAVVEYLRTHVYSPDQP